MALQIPSRPDRAQDQLAYRALHSRAASTARRARRSSFTLAPDALAHRLRRLPVRFLLHGVIAALIPLAFLLSQIMPLGARLTPAATAEADPRHPLGAALIPLSPITLEPADQALIDLPVPDSAFAEIAALPEAQMARSRQDILAPTTFASAVVGGEAHVRNGPGLLYDAVGALPAETPLTLEAYAEDWFVARTADGQPVWIAAELVANAATARGLLAPATEIPPPPPPKVAVVGEEGLSLRDGPGTAYVKLDSLARGTTIDLLSRYDTWFEVRHPGGAIGWVTGDFLNIAEGVIPRLEVLAAAPDPSPALIATTGATANLRGGPGTAYPRLGAVSGGAQLELVARYKDWLKVRAADGTAAWVFKDLLRVSDYVARRVPAAQNIPALPKPAAPATAARPAARSNVAPLSAAASGGVVSFAMQFRGTPYAWAGSSPAGFDCSGFTRYVYAQFGLSLPHSAAGQYSQRYGAFVDRASLQPGDIVFFANTYKRGLSHVGIYVGNGMVVQALAPGTPLAAVSMNGAYWNSKYYGALRPNL